MFEDGGVRSAGHVTSILGVPIGEQHHQHFEALQLPGADERIVVPGPAVLLEVLSDMRIIELESSVGEAATLVDAVARALETRRSLDPTGWYEVGRLGKIAAGPGQPYGEILRSHFVTPLDPPAAPVCIADRNARLRSHEVFFNKLKRRRWRTAPPARSICEVQSGDVAGMAP